MDENSPKPFGIAEVWSKGFAEQPERELLPRNYLWATDLGKPPIEVWLKMKGTKPTNPPNDRAKMKMEAGNIVEGVIRTIFKRAGVLKAQQIEANTIVDGVEIHGKLDLIAGGKVDKEAAIKYMDSLEDALSDGLKRAALKTIEYLETKFPEGLPEQPFEIKSIATFGMDAMELSRRALRVHRLQAEHYLFTLGYPAMQLSYVCRDDYRMIEHAILPTPENHQEYLEAVKELGIWIKSDIMPPKAPLIMFDTESGKFTKNLGVEWSNYLELIYGFKEPREYSEIYGKKATSWNNVLKRVRDGASMTAKNLEYIAEMKEMGHDAMALAPLYKPGANEEEV